MEIARVFFDVPMYYAFPGLKEIMKKAQIKVDAIAPGKFTVFINKSQTAFKVLIGPNLLVYCNNGTRKFPLEAIQNFPEFFDGAKLDYAGAVKKAIKEKYAHLDN